MFPHSTPTKQANHRTHGLSHTPEYKVWQGMKDRCGNPNHKSYTHYGARGIAICAAWLDFAVFYADMGPRPDAHHTIERLDNDGPYCKANCVWVTMKTQQRNRSNNRLLTYNGVTQTLAAWGEQVGISDYVIRRRIDRNGWSVERALTTATHS